MLYISKGLLRGNTGDGHITVAWRGNEYDLEGENARLWLVGRYETALAEARSLAKLANLGLVDTADADGPLNIYRLLTNCVVSPAPPRFPRWPLRRTERLLWRWIRRAGLRLTLAELVFLLEQDICPVPELLGEANRQALTEVIYNTENIEDRMLENRMEEAFGRDAVVEALLGLLRKQYIMLI
jgi:hypothetical protein